MSSTKPASSIDFLIDSLAESPTQARRDSERSSRTDDLIDKTVALFAGQVLNTLREAPGQAMAAFDLVDATHMNIQVLHQVLDAIASRYGWIELDKADPKGNYKVRLSDFGKKYLEGFLQTR